MLVVILLLLSVSLNISHAFDAGFLELGSTNQNPEDTTHYSMTVCALCRVTIDYLKTAYKIDTTYLETRFKEINGQCQGTIVNDIVNSLTNAQSNGVNPSQFTTTIKTIASANTKTDLKELLEEDSHFDSEQLRDGSQLIMKRYQATIESVIKEDNFDQARNTFGEMLHTLQDFYSHTNFIELGYTSPSNVLGQRIFEDNEYTSITMRTCISCEGDDCQTKSNLDPTIQTRKLLTSGYFIPIGLNIFQRQKPTGKCSHGGFFDATSDNEPTGGINKDKLSSVHGHLHYQAANIAYQATVKILTQLRNEIGDDDFGLFLTLKKNLNSLVVLIDTTYSITDYLELAKDISINIVNQYGPLEFAPHNYILIIFNSDSAQVIVNSRNPNDLVKSIRSLKSYQTTNSTFGDMYYQGLVEGLKKCEYASVIYTFTDSPAKDAYLKYQARALLRNKQAVIYSFISDNMMTNASNPQLDVLDGRNNDADLASISGGLTFPITNGDQSVISQFILRRLEWTRLQSLFMYKSNSASIVFYVDSSINEIYLDTSSINEINNINAIELRTPNNSLYPLTESYINTTHLYMWKILQPSVGAWRLTTSNLLSQGFDYDVQIQGKTSIICSSTLQKEIEPTTDSSGYTQLTTEPVMDSDLFIFTTCESLLLSNVNISLIDQLGNVITSYAPIESNQLGTLTRIRVPQKRFRIQTIITLSNGTKIQRIEKQLISPTIFSIELTNRPRFLSPGETIVMNYTIKSNKSGSVTVRLQIIDTLKLINNDSIAIDLTFINETSGVKIITLPKDYKSSLSTNLVIFSVSTQNNQTKRFLYENDEVASVYLDINSASILNTINCFIILFPLLLHHMCTHN